MNKNCQKLKIQEISQKQVWEDFLMKCDNKTFLNSWNWGEFQEKMGDKIWRIGILENSELIAVVLIIKITARRGNFLFIPHCPSIINSRVGDLRAILEVLIKKLKDIAEKENCGFIRISPICEKNKNNIEIFKKLKFVNAPIHMHPELTWELDISLSEEQLLKNMRKTTRYLIKHGEKNKDIEICISDNLNDVDKFNEIYQTTSNRHNFTPFSINYLKNEFLSFSPDNEILIFLGKYKNEVVSSAIIIFWQGTGFYHQGASSQKYSKIPVSYVMQWQAIKQAKKMGCKLYNFWGISPDTKNKKHPWYGLTLFKMGFNGYRKEFVKTQDLILSQKYWLNYIVEKIRKIKRRL